jgi:anti-sigma regulatory factor (Ser/Thr protein kinase)
MLDNGGMGLNLIRQTASSLSYERKDGRNQLTLFFPD